MKKPSKKGGRKKIKRCKICGNKTSFAFNINYKQVLICERCEGNIVKQSIIYKYNNEN